MLRYTMHATIRCSLLAVLLCLTAAAAAASCSNSSYYVVAPDGDPCPNSSSTCRELSYYTNQTTLFASNTIFYFLKGHHILDQEDSVTITNVTNLIWQGMGGMEMGPHDTTMQSSVVIKCNRSTGGFRIRDSQFVTIFNITLIDCASDLVFDPYFYFTAVGLRLEHLFNTHLRHISIRNSSGISLYALNCFNLTIEDSSFFYNQVPVHNLNKFLLFGANVLVAYSGLSQTNSSDSNSFNKLMIVRSNFSFSIAGQAIPGSGLSLYLGAHKHDILIDNVVAYNNSGGGNINVCCNTSQYTITINNTRSLYGTSLLQFDNNNTFSGGFFLSHEYNNGSEAKVIVHNSVFSHNQGSLGGGMAIIWLASSAGEVLVNNCTFYNNTGNFSSALYVFVSLAVRIYYGDVNLKLTFVNSTFHDNQPFKKRNLSVQSTITVQNVADIEFDSINVSNNPTTGLIAYSSTIKFTGNNIFLNNSGVDGGGMALYGSYFVLSGPTLVNLTANSASHNGGGLYISQPFDPVVTTCLFQINDSVNVDARIVLFKNTAGVTGSALYGGNQLSNCLLFSNRFFNASSVLHVIHDQDGPNDISSDPDKVCLCNNGTVDCSNFTYSTSAVPGKQFSVSVSTVGNMNGSSEGIIVVHSTDANIPSTLVYTSAKCKTLSYELKVTDNQTKEVQVTLSLQAFLVSPLTPPQRITAGIEVLECPEGFQVNPKSGICDCSDLIVSMNFGVLCDIATDTIAKKENVWLGNSNSCNCFCVSDFCPLGYCKQGSVNFSITDPDSQCALNRSGVLCGACADGLSVMLGTNGCGECYWPSILLLLIFAMLGILLVVLLIILNLTVSVGTINGLIFYANIVKIEEDYLFPHNPVQVLSLFISWINLDFGINICFAPVLTGYIKTWLQFVFPVYIFTIMVVIIICAKWSKFLQSIIGSQIVPVLATLSLLSFTKLIRTVIQALHFKHVSCNSGVDLVWFVDGNVKYLGFPHYILFIWALIVLVGTVLYTSFLLATPLIERYLTRLKCFRRSVSLKPILDAYGGPYKDKYRSWTGVLLLVRVVLALITSLSDSQFASISALMCTMVILITIHCLARGVYTKWYLNVLEIAFLLNLMLLGYVATKSAETAVRQGEQLGELHLRVSTSILFVTSFLLFLGIISYHIHLKVKPKFDIQKYYRKYMKNLQAKMFSKSASTADESFVHSDCGGLQLNDRYRETLLESNFHEFIEDN